MSSSLTKLNEAEIPVLMRHLDKFTAFFSKPAITQRTSIADSEEFVEELITEITDCYKKARECINVAFKIHQIYEKTNEKLRKISYKNEALKNQVEEMKNHIQDQANEYIVKEKRLESLSHDLYDTEQGFKAMVSENKQLKRDLYTLKKEIQLREEGTRARASSQEVKKPLPDLKQEQINALQAELKKQIEEGEGLVFQIKDLENLLKIEKANSERLKISNGALRKELDDTNEEVEILQNEKSELIEQSEIYKSEIIQQRILIENLKRIQERDRMRATFTSDAGFSNHAEDEESPSAAHDAAKDASQDPTQDATQDQSQYKITTNFNEGDSPRDLLERKINQWRKTMSENLGEIFEVEEELVDEKQFFVLSSSNSVYGQFPSFVDSVKDRPILSEESLQSISIEGKAKRKSEIFKIFELELKRKEPKLRIVEMEVEKTNSVKIMPFKDFSRLRIEKQNDIFTLKNVIELSIENLPIVTVIEDRKKKLAVNSVEIIEIRKQEAVLEIENLQVTAIEHKKNEFAIKNIESIEIRKQGVKLSEETVPIIAIIEHKHKEFSIKSIESIEIRKQGVKLSAETVPIIAIIEHKHKEFSIKNIESIEIRKQGVKLSAETVPIIAIIEYKHKEFSIKNIEGIEIRKQGADLSAETVPIIAIVEHKHKEFSIKNIEGIEIRKQGADLSAETVPIIAIVEHKHKEFSIKNIEGIEIRKQGADLSAETVPTIAIIEHKQKEFSIKSIETIQIKKEELELFTENLPAVEIIEHRKKEFFIKSMESIHIKKQELELFIESSSIAILVEPKKKELLIQCIDSIEIRKHEIELKIEYSPILAVTELRNNDFSIKSLGAIEIQKRKTDLEIEKMPEIFIKEEINCNLLIEVIPLIAISEEKTHLSNVSISTIFINKSQIENKIEEQSSISIAKEKENLLYEDICKINIADNIKNSFSIEKMPLINIQDISISITNQESQSSNSLRNSIGASTVDSSIFFSNESHEIPVLSLKNQAKYFTFEVKNQNQIGIISRKSVEMKLETTPILKLESQSTGHSSPSLEIHTQDDSIFIQSPKAQNLILESIPILKFGCEDKKYTHTFAMDYQIEKDLLIETASTIKDDRDRFSQKLIAEAGKEPEILMQESISIKQKNPKKLSGKKDEKNASSKQKTSQTFASTGHKSEIFELDFLNSLKSSGLEKLPSKKSKKNRHTNRVIFTKDPIKQFFILTCEAAKLNSEKRDYIGQIPFDILYNKVFEEHIPFNSWHDYIQKFLHSKTSAINV